MEKEQQRVCAKDQAQRRARDGVGLLLYVRDFSHFYAARSDWHADVMHERRERVRAQRRIDARERDRAENGPPPAHLDCPPCIQCGSNCVTEHDEHDGDLHCVECGSIWPGSPADLALAKRADAAQFEIDLAAEQAVYDAARLGPEWSDVNARMLADQQRRIDEHPVAEQVSMFEPG